MKLKTVYIEITNQCNLNCKTCYNRSGLNNAVKEITVEQLDEIIKTLIANGCDRLLWGGGEPTAHSRFDDILDFADKYPQIGFGVVTNGIIYNEKLLNACKTKENITMQVSLDGSCEEVNSKTRGKGSFNKTERFIDGLRESKKKPLVKMVISQNNLEDVESFYRFALSKNCIPEYAFLNKQGNGYENWDTMALTAKQKLNVVMLLDKLNKELSTEAFLPLCTSICPLAHGHDNMSVTIRTDGTIIPCQLLYADCFVLGNIFSFDIDSFNDSLNRISELVKEREATDYGCTKCVLRSTCKKGCMATAYHVNRDPLSSDGDCEFRKLQLLGFHIKGMG